MFCSLSLPVSPFLQTGFWALVLPHLSLSPSSRPADCLDGWLPDWIVGRVVDRATVCFTASLSLSRVRAECCNRFLLLFCVQARMPSQTIIIYPNLFLLLSCCYYFCRCLDVYPSATTAAVLWWCCNAFRSV